MEGNWFYEKNLEFPGQSFGLEIKQVLFKGKSDYQDVLVFDSVSYGKVLVLDGVIQCTERDECAYQEMISFLPLNSHPAPKKVLIVGGGDGGVAREVVKHPSVEAVDLCEIDQMVIDVSKKYLEHMAVGLTHPKVTVYVEDGFAFMEKRKNCYDVIIADTSDPAGPAVQLFQSPFYKLMRDALKEDGLLSAQGECMWIDMKLITRVLSFCQDIFPVTSYAFSSVPTYTTGNLGFILCSKNKKTKFSQPLRRFSHEEQKSLNLRYYNQVVHKCSFGLPEFARKELQEYISKEIEDDS